jgi:hypothetical protein
MEVKRTPLGDEIIETVGRLGSSTLIVGRHPYGPEPYYVLAWLPDGEIEPGSVGSSPEESLRRALPHLRLNREVEFEGSAVKILAELDLVASWKREAERARIAYEERTWREEREKGAVALSRFKRSRIRLTLSDASTAEVSAVVRGPWAIHRNLGERRRIFSLTHLPTSLRAADHEDRGELALLSERLDALGSWETASLPKQLLKAGNKLVWQWRREHGQLSGLACSQ